MQEYTFHKNIIIRTPSESFSPYLNEQIIKDYVSKDNPFLEATYLGSPSLYTAIKDSEIIDRKTLLSLTKYIIRNRSRSTPFGLFSGVGVAKWGGKTDISISEDFKRHTRLDMNYLCTLAQELNKKEIVRKNVTYFSNSSLYLLGEDIRYVEYRYINGQRSHQISSIKTNEYIENILYKARAGVKLETLLDDLIDEEVSSDEAYAFINELIDAQLIVSELEPAITGSEFLLKIVEVLKKIHTKDEYITIVLTTLQQLDIHLNTLDLNRVNSQQEYSKIIELIKVLEIPFEESKLFQTDKVFLLDNIRNTVSEDIKKEILRVSKKLSTLGGNGENYNIVDFISRFQDRYEDEEVPLLNALDTETGVGYLAHKYGDYTPLTEDIVLPQSLSESNGLRWQEIQRKLFKRLQQATHEGLSEISFSSIGLDENQEDLNLCPTFSTMFRVIGDKRIYIESIGGSSAANLIGRFAHASDEISQILTDISEAERKNNPEIIFAEIVHLPESRTGNILLRPAFRNYEIPYLSNSNQPIENQIQLQDIYVSVRHGRIILRHKKLNKIIIPRLGTAHNFTYNALPVYQFLCDLQTQGLQAGIGFSWGQIAREFVFLPRVIDGNTILSPATWQFSIEHLKSIQKKDVDSKFLETWINQYKLPQRFVLAEGDNELFIDTSVPILVDVFLDSIKKKNNILIKEYLWEDSIPIKNSEGKTMANQLVATLIRNKPVYNYKSSSGKKSNIQRTFSIGSEWMYLKLYCGAKSADSILQDGVYPMVQEAKENGWIDKWFFIRYTDPNYHLRLRFHITNLSHLKKIIDAVETYIKPFEKNGIIWKIQTDTYKRELERYGYETIELGESYFGIDSDMYLDFLNITEGDTREDYKWLWGLSNINTLLDLSGFKLDDKKVFMETLRNNFASEFNMNQDLKSQLDKKYRLSRNQIKAFIDFDTSVTINIKYKETELEEIFTDLEKLTENKSQFHSILSSYIHMLINRLISSNQRLHELLMYDFLYRHYVSELAQQKKSTASSFFFQT